MVGICTNAQYFIVLVLPPSHSLSLSFSLSLAFSLSLSLSSLSVSLSRSPINLSNVEIHLALAPRPIYRTWNYAGPSPMNPVIDNPGCHCLAAKISLVCLAEEWCWYSLLDDELILLRVYNIYTEIPQKNWLAKRNKGWNNPSRIYAFFLRPKTNLFKQPPTFFG